MTYATKDDVLERYRGDLDDALCESLLEEAGALIDACNENADWDVKKIVSVRIVVRVLSSFNDQSVPLGASQGTISALGYSQTWTLGSGGSAGELYLSKSDKQLLRCSNRIGARSPLEA